MNTEKLKRFFAQAVAAADHSKDTSTQVGALLIGPEGEGGPFGYNGAPRHCEADSPGDPRGERPEKYFWFEHAERNVIYSAARTGYRTIGCTMIVTHPPCMDCARAIVQAGIKRVCYPRPESAFLERWQEHYERALRLFDECGVEIIEL